MSVSETLQLPAQPTTGITTYVPLGGDGFTSPIAAFNVQGFALTGAVGGGFVGHRISMDPRYCSLIQYITLTNNQVASADADYRLLVASDQIGTVPNLTDSGLATAIGAGIASGATIEKTWAPVPTVLPGGNAQAYIVSRMLNVDADVVRLACVIFLFDIRVRQTTPMGPLLWARGAT